MIIVTTQDEMRDIAFTFIPKDGSLLLELGCSNGNFANLVMKHNIKNYVGVDIQIKKIQEAMDKFPALNFICCDITKNLTLLKDIKTFVSFQCLEHIQNDLDIIKAIPPGCLTIFSVPNRPYKGHIRWFEVDGWKNRFEPYIDFIDIITIQHPRKEGNRSFLFKGIKK